MSEAPSDKTVQGPENQRGVVDVLLYAAARLLLAVVVSAAIYAVARLLGVNDFPLAVAGLFGLVVAMPLGMWLFSPLRRRAAGVLEVTGERRRTERAQLQARLRGEAPAGRDPDPEPERQAGGGT